MDRRGQVVGDQGPDAPPAETTVQVAQLHGHLLNRRDFRGTGPVGAVLLTAAKEVRGHRGGRRERRAEQE